jgi:hypothetical protein
VALRNAVQLQLFKSTEKLVVDVAPRCECICPYYKGICTHVKSAVKRKSRE